MTSNYVIRSIVIVVGIARTHRLIKRAGISVLPEDNEDYLEKKAISKPIPIPKQPLPEYVYGYGYKYK